MTAEKDNKVYTIDESMKNHYAAEGYDIKDDDGNVIAYGKGKTVSYEEYQKAVQELEALKNKETTREAKEEDMPVEKSKNEKSTASAKKTKEEDV